MRAEYFDGERHLLRDLRELAEKAAIRRPRGNDARLVAAPAPVSAIIYSKNSVPVVVTVKVTHCVSGTWAVPKNTTTKPPRPRRSGQPWALWQRLAQVRTDFGNPAARSVTFLTGAFVRDIGFATAGRITAPSRLRTRRRGNLGRRHAEGTSKRQCCGLCTQGPVGTNEFVSPKSWRASEIANDLARGIAVRGNWLSSQQSVNSSHEDHGKPRDVEEMNGQGH